MWFIVLIKLAHLRNNYMLAAFSPWKRHVDERRWGWYVLTKSLELFPAGAELEPASLSAGGMVAAGGRY